MFFFRTDVILSLNKQTPLEGDDETLTSLGIVPGDLIYVLNTPIQYAVPQAAVTPSVLQNDSQLCAVPQAAVTPSVLQNDNQLSAVNNDRYNNTLGMTSSVVDNIHCAETEMQEGECSCEEVTSTQSCSQTDTSDLSNCHSVINQYLNEPVLVRESTDHQMPQTVVCAYSMSQPTTNDMAIFVIINILMSELGFKLLKVGIKSVIVYCQKHS
jgi:hypothetical protein